MVGQDLLGDHVARHEPTDDAGADDRARPAALASLAAAVAAGQRHHRRGRVLRAGLAEVAGQQPEQLLQIARQRRVAVHLDAEVLEGGHARRLGDAARRRPQELLVDTAHRRVVGHRQGAEDRFDVGAPDRVLVEPRPRDQTLLHEHGHQRGQAPRVGTRPDGQVEVGELGRLAPTGIDDDQRAVGIAGDLLERGAGMGQAVRLPRVLADEQRHLGVLHVAPHHRAQHLGVDPELAGLLLGQGVRPVAAAERPHGGAAVRAAQVVPLATAAEVEDRGAAVGVTHLGQA